MHFCRPVKIGQSFITAQWKIYCTFGADRLIFGADRPGVGRGRQCFAPAIGQDLLFENERSSTARSLPSGTIQRN